jgi:hypothetical protein
MLILDILKKAGAAGATIIALLEKAKALSPDVLGPEIDKILSGEAGAVALDNLIALAECLPKELANIAAGKLDPRRHSSDVA